MQNYISSQSTSLLGETLSQFVLSFPQSCTLKDPVTKKYILVNQFFETKIGLPAKNIIHHNLQELIAQKGEVVLTPLNKKVLEEINRLDRHVLEHQTTISSEKNIFSTREGILLVENYIKIPIFDQHNKLGGILTYSQDLTAQCDLFSLLSIYQSHYPLQKAIKTFLQYLKIDHYFTQLPTHREIMSLLAMFLDNSHKHVARLLEVKAKTAETHIYQLRNKLNGIPLSDVLKMMRSNTRTMCLRTLFIDYSN